MEDATVELLLSNLQQLLVYNADLIISIKPEIESLLNDLGKLKAFVKKASKGGSNNAIEEELVRQIIVEVHKAEDIVDMYVFHASQKTRTGFGKALHIPDYAVKLRGVGKAIKVIQIRVKELYENKLFLNNEEKKELEVKVLGIDKEAEKIIGRLKEEKKKLEVKVVGIDKEAEKIIGWLKEEKKELEVISVVGMGGSGKTTLVKKVYNDPSIQYEFPIRSWVYVPQVYSPRDVFLYILDGVTQETSDTSDWSVDTIANELRSKLKDVKYLIVLDDIWTKKAWDELKIAFPHTKNGSRILITSRNKDVAVHANTSLPPYQLRFLTDDESWDLLEGKVFLNGTRCPPELESLGKQIARRCCGLPFLVVVIAGTLKKKDKVPSLWEKFEQRLSSYVAIEPEQCTLVLDLCYRHLPYDLKACFLYFSVFPCDFEIPVWKLIHIWVAEGFIQQIGSASLEEMAEENLQELVDRNFVLVEQRRANGGIKTCRVHDMLHDLCVKRAKHEDFFHRVSAHSRVSDYLSSQLDFSHVRSFLCYAGEETVLSPGQMKFFSDSLKLLRVLDALPIIFTRFPSTRLVHLRYVALLGTFEVLPAAISNLCNLQTLIVKTKFRNIEVKADLWKLLQLRHVYTSAASVLPTPSSNSQNGGKDPLVNLNLRTMSKVSPNSCTDVILIRTPNLQKLGVRGNLALLLDEKNGCCKFDNITKLSHLEKLKLLNDTYPNSPLDGGKLCGLPEWNKFPQKLRKLTLSDTMLDWDHMSVLEKLQGLEVLKLGDNAFVGKRWVISDGAFVQLRVLQIGKTDLVHWETAGNPFPLLQRVSLKHCEHLIAIPSSLGDILTLELMELSSTSHLAIASARSIQKNFELRVSFL